MQRKQVYECIKKIYIHESGSLAVLKNLAYSKGKRSITLSLFTIPLKSQDYRMLKKSVVVFSAFNIHQEGIHQKFTWPHSMIAPSKSIT